VPDPGVIPFKADKVTLCLHACLVPRRGFGMGWVCHL